MNRLLIIALCYLITACSNLSMQVWYEDTDTLINKHNYIKALSQVENTTPINQGKLKEIQTKANIYTRKELKYLQTLLIKKQWSDAEIVLNDLIKKVPDNSKISEAKLQLTQLRQLEELDIRVKVLISHANLLIAKQADASFQLRNKGQKPWYESNEQLSIQVIDTSNSLLILAKQSLETQQLENAKLALKFAKKLNEDLPFSDLQHTIDQELLKRSLATLEQKQSRSLNRLKKAIENENFEQIIHLTRALKNPALKNKEITSLINMANSLLYENAQELNLSADHAYRLGNIKEAIQLWQQAQTLHPQLLGISEKLLRAQKVSDKLDLLRQSQAQ